MQADDLLVAVSAAVKGVMVSAGELGCKAKDYAQWNAMVPVLQISYHIPGTYKKFP